MKKVTSVVLAGLAAFSLALSGCGSSSPGSASPAATTVTVSGALEPGAAKATLKTAAAAGTSIGTVTAIDAATGAVLSATPATIVPDSTGTGGTFSGLKFTPPSTQAGIILKATLSNGKTYRSLITSEVAPSTSLTATVGPNSDAIVTAVSGSLSISGVLGDDGVKVPVGTKLADVASAATTVSGDLLPKLQTGYVIDTGGTGVAVPGVTLIDRVAKTVTKTVRFTNQVGTRIGHFANASADGSELWLCSGQGGTTGVMNVYNTAVFKTYSTLNDSNKASFIKHSFAKGCGVQNVQSPDGRYIFASVDQSPKGVNVFDTKNHAYLGTITNGNTAPHVGAVSADGKKYYTTTAGSSHAVGYDISGLPAQVPGDANKILDVNLGYGSLHAVRLHPNGKYLFVGNNTWPVPATLPAGITAATSGTNVIDIATQKIIATIPGRPHNYALSPDGNYLLVTELSSPDCEVSLPGDPGNRLQFIDISTLASATPDATKIKDIYHFDTPGFGGSHASWDPTTGVLYYSVYDTANQGWLYLLNTAGLSAAVPSVTQLGEKQKIGWAPHGVFFPGIDGD
jgi:hypothetical protein